MIDVTNIDTTGHVDATGAINDAINQAVATGVRRVVLPDGLIRACGINIPRGIELCGQGWEEYRGAFCEQIPQVRGRQGTYLLQDATTSNLINVGAQASNAAVRDIAFIQTMPPDCTDWEPTNYGPIIQRNGSGAGSFVGENLLFWGVNRGIHAGYPGGPVGRTTLRNIRGYAYTDMIRIIYDADVPRIKEVHCNPGYCAGRGINTEMYARRNGRAIVLERADGAVLDDIFVFGMNTGVEFSQGADGIAAGFTLGIVRFDTCAQGILITGNDITGSIVDIDCGPGVDLSRVMDTRCIWNLGSGNTVHIHNAKLHVASHNGLRVDGSWNDFTLGNVWCETWNLSGGGHNALSGSPNNKITVLGRLRTENGNGADSIGGGANFLVPHQSHGQTSQS